MTTENPTGKSLTTWFFAIGIAAILIGALRYGRDLLIPHRHLMLLRRQTGLMAAAGIAAEEAKAATDALKMMALDPLGTIAWIAKVRSRNWISI
ncbi:MAG: hypothetical protein ABJX32_11165 [Tateyamaria sp.]|uniref:hypothetical protein n=1 Tax=Tateyamaria sp. TaxID=1929288 RepID=UPI00329C967E